MSNTLTMYGRTLLMSALFTPDAFVLPTNVEVALCQRVPTANSPVDQLLEPDPASSYARQPYAFSAVHWGTSGFGDFVNLAQITYPLVDAGGWGMISGWALIDADAVECIAVGSALEPYLTELGLQPFIPAGAITLGIFD